MFKDLNEFISALDKARELARIGETVDPDVEICAVTDRVSKSPGGGPGLLFERPKGFDIPVAVNLFGSMRRVCMALGVDTLDALAREIEELTTPKIPGGLVDALSDDARVQLQRRRRSLAGITRPELDDELKTEEASKDTVHIAVIMVGYNDRWNIRTSPRDFILLGSPEWRAEYGRRADR